MPVFVERVLRGEGVLRLLVDSVLSAFRLLSYTLFCRCEALRCQLYRVLLKEQINSSNTLDQYQNGRQYKQRRRRDRFPIQPHRAGQQRSCTQARQSMIFSASGISRVNRSTRKAQHLLVEGQEMMCRFRPFHFFHNVKDVCVSSATSSCGSICAICGR